MAETMEGVVTIVQESRFQLTDDEGVSHLFILGHSAAADPEQLPPLQAEQARVRVRYKPAKNLIGHIVTSIARAS